MAQPPILYHTHDIRKTCASRMQTNSFDLLRRSQVYLKQAALMVESNMKKT